MHCTLKYSLILCALLTALAAWSPVVAGEQHTSFNVHKNDQGEAPRESIFDLTFGSAPRLATERGILVIDAFFDADGDMLHGPDEDTLSDDIQCTVNDIDYQVPAFIPGLDYQETYELNCKGERYHPQVNEELVFIRKRGQVINIDLPCRLHYQEDKVLSERSTGKTPDTLAN